MKQVKIVIGIWLLLQALVWVHDRRQFGLIDLLPFVEKNSALPPGYDWAALIMIGIFAWGLYRLNRKKGQK